MTTHAHLTRLALAFVLLIVVAAPSAAQTAKGPEAQALERALKLLPQRPTVPIRLIDPELAADPDAVRRLDAFLIRDSDGRVRPVIYLNQRSALIQKALSGGRFDLAVLAAVIRHEQEHLRGGTEVEARHVELTFFQSLIRDGQVASDQGLAYLKQLTQQYRHQ
jgi:hypothetical protein